MGNKVNIKTIAELSGVSVATVSRVINQNGRFSAETEAAVRRVMKELDYHPNTVAKSLREKHSKVIGVIVPDIMNAHFARLVLEIETYLFTYGYSTVICNTNESAALEQKHVDTLISQRVGGILLISGIRHYKPDDIPLVYVDRRPENYNEKRDCLVESDNEDGGYRAARRLVELGCRRVAILYAFDMDFNQKMRYRGYRRAMEEAGMEPLSFNVETVSAPVATACIKEQLDRGEEFDGLLCTTDLLAIGALIGLQEKGIAVPGQVRLTGFDDSAIAGLYRPSVSSIRQQVAGMARMSADMLLALIEGKTLTSMHQVLPVRLVERETTGGLAPGPSEKELPLLKPLAMRFSVCKVTDYSGIDMRQPFCFTGITDEENSLVCPENMVPDNTTEREDGWKGFRITGQLDFSLIGILAGISEVLASNDIGIFAVSTFNTDYIFMKEENFDRGLTALKNAGYRLGPSGS